MAVIRLHKTMKVRKIKDDSLVDPYSRTSNEFGAN
jgi:glucosamine--fructose-6-phosphate aminotransferase (isomerizing)